jgi:hypothetical protein
MGAEAWGLVRELHGRLNDDRAELYARWPDRWIVMTVDGVVSDHTTEAEAFESAYRAFEPGTFLIDLVSERERVLLTGFNAIC